MSERITKQLYDDGSVIGYVPKLQYKKDVTGTSEAYSSVLDQQYAEGTDLTIYSKTLNGFGQNMPSHAIEAIDYAINNMEMLMDRLVEKFLQERKAGGATTAYSESTGISGPYTGSVTGYGGSTGNGTGSTGNAAIVTQQGSSAINGSTGIQGSGAGISGGGIPSTYSGGNIGINNSNNWNGNYDDSYGGNIWPMYNDPEAFRDSLDNDDETYSNEFVNYHQYDINGSQIPELMQNIHYSESNLEGLREFISNAFYGQHNISASEAASIDQGYIDAMRESERNDTQAIINYPMISYDAMFSKSVQIHAYKDNKQAINVANVIVKRDKGTATANNMDVVKKLYDDVNLELDARANAYAKNQSIELMQKALYNYYETRKYLNDLFKLRHEGTSNKSIFIGRKIQEYMNKTEEALRDVNRVFKLDQLHLQKITELEKEKFFIKSLYRSTSSNL